MRVVWTEKALDGIARAYDYLYDFNPQAAMRVAENIREVGNGLVNFPHRGRMVPRTTMREVMSSYPYIIRYRIVGDEIVILRVRHMARRPTKR
jgi:plasmid stabilization system protein ParE